MGGGGGAGAGAKLPKPSTLNFSEPPKTRVPAALRDLLED